MPRKIYRSNPSYRMPVASVQLDVEAIVELISGIAQGVVDNQARIMAEMAIARAPVRRMKRGRSKQILKGNRVTNKYKGYGVRGSYRELTKGELISETPFFLKTLSLSGKTLPKGSLVPTRSGSYLKNRVGVKTSRAVNKNSTWNGGKDRRVGWSVQPGGWQVSKTDMNNYAEVKDMDAFKRGLHLDYSEAKRKRIFQSLSGAALYDFRKAKIEQVPGQKLMFRDVGRGALYWNPAEMKFYFGGNLRHSIKVNNGEDSLHKIISAGGENAPYARYVEFGTRKMAARPFMRPAYQHIKHTFRERLFTALKRAESYKRVNNFVRKRG